MYLTSKTLMKSKKNFEPVALCVAFLTFAGSGVFFAHQLTSLDMSDNFEGGKGYAAVWLLITTALSMCMALGIGAVTAIVLTRRGLIWPSRIVVGSLVGALAYTAYAIHQF